jgi:hypothetical protein
VHVSALQRETLPARSRARAEKQYVMPGEPTKTALVAVVALCQGASTPKPPS